MAFGTLGALEAEAYPGDFAAAVERHLRHPEPVRTRYGIPVWRHLCYPRFRRTICGGAVPVGRRGWDPVGGMNIRPRRSTGCLSFKRRTSFSSPVILSLSLQP